MPRDILNEYGPDTAKHMEPSMKKNGPVDCKPLPYSSPQGPTNIGDSKSPGLHGHNCGNAGSQGHYDSDSHTSGSPGLHGDNRGMGTNRRG